MSFASPDRLLWLLLALPIILFYLLRTRPRRLPVSTLLFWEQLFEQKRQRSWWQRLRHLLSLLLQLAFLGLVTMALVDPLWPDQEDRLRRVAIVLDNSASMQAREGEQESRFEKARTEALRVVSHLRDGDEATLITAGGTVRAAVGVTDFAPSIREALKTVSVTDSPTDIPAAVALARRLVADRERREIIVISDGCFDGVEEIEAADDVRLIGVGQPLDNVAITALQTRRSLVDPIGYSIFVEVQNKSDKPQESRLTIELGTELVDVLPLEMEPDAVWKKTFNYASREGGQLALRLDVEDALPLDNVARAIVPPRPPIPVTLVTDRSSLYVQKVFEAIPLVELTITDSPAAAAPAGGITVLHGMVPEVLTASPLLVIDPQQDSPRWQLGAPQETALVAEQATDSPLLAHVQLMNVTLPGGRHIDLTGDAVPLLTSAEGSVLMTAAVDPAGRMLVLASNVDDGDLPLRIVFPVMMTNAMNWLLDRTGEFEPTVVTGKLAALPGAGGETLATTTVSSESENNQLDRVVPADDPAVKSALLWQDPVGTQQPVSLADDKLLFGPIDRTGIVRIGTAAQLADDPEATAGDTSRITGQDAVREVAVNLSNAAESDLRPQRTAEMESASLITAAGYRSIWFYLSLIAFGFIMIEWIFYQRRIVA